MAHYQTSDGVSRGNGAACPLVVDLDGTLIRTDLLIESLFSLLKRNILFLFLLPVWLLKGKAHLKNEIAARTDIDAGLLPYHEEFLNYLRSEHAGGRRLVLATASNERFAEAVALNLGIFHDVLASNAKINLSGSAKLKHIQALYGNSGFDYAANAMVDLPLWKSANSVILVNPERGVTEAVKRQRGISRIFDDRPSNRLIGYLRALRLHQWLKNLLVFIPILMAHQLGNIALIGQAFIAFLSFGLCASSVYLLNDLFDLSDDRQHPTKRYRPFAAGSISIVVGAVISPCLLIAAIALGSLLSKYFIGILALYYIITLAYSLRLKRADLIDVLALAGLYTLRIIAGAAAVSVSPSFWLLAFSMFLFLSLALVKRFTELLSNQQRDLRDAPGRSYSTTDLETLSQFGSTSAYMAVLVLALYINSQAVQELYSHPEVIWLLCPLLLYMIMRIWLLARRGVLHEDPVVFVIRDHRSQWLAGLGLILLWLAI